ncbi:hypothetical protein I4U23_020845 [Adineta vaga]|nr:hypothetical protein I4U23_020845 [Adineta vaga]
MVDKYDISRNPSDLPRSLGIVSVRAGASRQHFLSFDDARTQQESAHRQLTAYVWQQPTSEENKKEKEIEDVFSTEIDAEVYERYAIETFLPGGWSKGAGLRDALKGVTDSHCGEFYEKAVELLEKRTNYELALVYINKCLLLKPYHIPLYEMRSEIYLNLCDFQSSILSLQKGISYKQVTSQKQQSQQLIIPARPVPLSNEEKLTNDKIAFLRYMSGISLFDQKLYIDALSIIATGADVFSTFPFQVYSVLCLTALDKIDEAIALINQMIEDYSDNADLLIIRARLYYKDKAKLPLCFYDVRDALTIDEHHPMAIRMMTALEEAAKNARDNSIRMSINEHLTNALSAINLALDLYPIEAEFHLQRSVIYRKMGKFELATDECLLLFDKTGHNEENSLYQQAQKQFVFIYNECSLKCLQTGFYDDAINLLNRAINSEKNSAGLYINRGDCFISRGQITFALQDYEQALELSPDNNEIKLRISNVFFNKAEQLYKEKRYLESATELTRAISVNPSVAKYYVSRSRVKFLTDDLQCAQEDIIAAILINPLEDGCIDVLPRLFVDTTLAEVLTSPLTKYVKENLIHRGVVLTIG